MATRSPSLSGRSSGPAQAREHRSRARRRPIGRAALVAACAAIALRVGCRAGAPEPAPFEGSAPDLDSLGREVLRALTSGEREALERLRLTEHEHNEVVWPELPASQPEINFPVDYAWSNIEGRHRRAYARIARVYEGQPLDFQDVECRGAAQRFRTFQVLTDCWVVFSRGEGGDVLEAQLFEDVLVRGGGHKYFRLYEEPPRRALRSGRSPSSSVHGDRGPPDG